MIYIVWVGGVSDYEGDSLIKAQSIYNQWIESGYDDVQLQTIEEATQ